MHSKAGSPDDWLRHAESDPALAKTALPESVILETMCFHT